MRVLVTGLKYFVDQFQSLVPFVWEDKTLKIFTVTRSRGYLRAFIRMALLLPKIDVWYQLGGLPCRHGRIYQWAYLWRKPVIVHWVGSDVLVARQCRNQLSHLIPLVVHWVGAPWLVDEVKDLFAIKEVQFMPVPLYTVFRFLQSTMPPFPREFQMATYLSDQQAAFYGWEYVYQLAKEFPYIPIHVIGSYGSFTRDIPSNVRFRGWVKEVEKIYAFSVVFLRLTQHDGYSGVVQESLALGRYVIWTYPFSAPGVWYVTSLHDLKERIEQLYTSFRKGELPLNVDGRRYIQMYLHPSAATRKIIRSFYKYTLASYL